jgi:hypothetical protein
MAHGMQINVGYMAQENAQAQVVVPVVAKRDLEAHVGLKCGDGHAILMVIEQTSLSCRYRDNAALEPFKSPLEAHIGRGLKFHIFYCRKAGAQMLEIGSTSNFGRKNDVSRLGPSGY